MSADGWGVESGVDSWNTPAESKANDSVAAGGDSWGVGIEDHSGVGGEHGSAFTCRNCAGEGHKAAECPEPRKLTGECFNCGEVGHNKADCTNPRVDRPFTGTCRFCGEEGHMAKDCHNKAPVTCRICSERVHKTEDCKAIRMDVFPADLPEMSADVAWAAMMKADKERDLDDFEEALFCYAKAQLLAGEPIDIVDIENGFRQEKRNTYCIAKKYNLHPTFTVVNLKGEPEQDWSLIFRYSPDPETPFEANGWPESAEENLERLKSCGFEVDRKIAFCRNCEKLGHPTKYCKEEKLESEGRVLIRCFNCEEVGHRSRDCTQPRVDRRKQCRNCNGYGHMASECSEPRSAANVECKVCQETGHFARDCPSKPDRPPMTCHNCGEEGHGVKDCSQPRKDMVCRNCDEPGHGSRECPKPRDYSRVQCKQCGQMGHTVVRCTQKEVADNGGDSWGNDNTTGTGDDGSGW